MKDIQWIMTRWMAIDELCEVAQGAVLSRLKDDQGEYFRIIQTANLDMLSLDELEFQRLSPQKTPTVQLGDVLVSLRGSPIRAAVVPEGMPDCVASPNIAVLKPRPPRNAEPPAAVEPNYLAGLLGSQYMRPHLYAHLGGGTIPSLSLRNLKALKIPVPALKLQIDFGRAFRAHYKSKVHAHKLFAFQAERLEAELALYIRAEDA